MDHLLNSYDDDDAVHLPYKKTKLSAYQPISNSTQNESQSLSKTKYPTMSIKNLISSRSPSPKYHLNTSDSFHSDSFKNELEFDYTNQPYTSTSRYQSSSYHYSPTLASIPDPVQEPSRWQRHCISSIKNLLFSDSSRSHYLGTQTPRNMTQVSCYLVTVAQKSYGSEKRYLNPPPIVTVTPPANQFPGATKLTSVDLTILNESGQDIITQKSLLHNDLAIFKTLHIANNSGVGNDGSKTDKSKSFRLKIQLHHHTVVPNPSHRPHSTNYMNYLPMISNHDSSSKSEPFATFLTDSIPIISKPSKKSFNQTLKSPSCIYSGSTISLFNRINHQTFRTQYLNVQNNKMCAKVNFWSPFIIKLYNYNGANVNRYNHASIISYKSCVTLTDPRTGMTFGPFILLKVEKNQILHDAQGPVTQLQKVALRSFDPSQPNPNPNDVPTYLATKKPSLTDSYSESSSTQSMSTLPIVLSAINSNDKGFVNSCTVEDHHYWTLVNITRLDFIYSTEANPNVATVSPFPIIAAKPRLQHNNTELIVDYQSPEGTSNLQIWIGCCGPITPKVPPTSAKCITYSLPSTNYILGENFSNYSDTHTPLNLPIFLINDKGVIYHTKCYLSLKVNDRKEIVMVQIV